MLKEGHFLLTSGLHSAHYLQCAQLLQYPEETAKLCTALAENFENQEITTVIGPAIGAIIMSYEVARHLKARSLWAERENGVMSLRRGFSLREGEKVLIVEDVVTTGGSVHEVIQAVKQHGAIPVGVGVLVDRSNGRCDFGIPMVSLIKFNVEANPPEDCRLCRSGVPLAKPGSRQITVMP